MAHVWQQPLPPIYRQLSEPELRLRIAAAKDTLGRRAVILGHHYQQDAVVDFADFVGDSFELSRRAADQKGIEFVIFCGVHFMAESADILTDPAVRVILPDLGAGCSMADMANLDQTLEAWEQLEEACPDQLIVPITYMNSSAAIKAFVGEHGGAVCTSSNCRDVLEWALKGGAEGTEDGEGTEARRHGGTKVRSAERGTGALSSSPGFRVQGSGNANADAGEIRGTGALSLSAGFRVQGSGNANDAADASLNPEPLNPEPSPLTPEPQTLNPEPSPLNPAKKVKILFFPDQHLGRNTAFAMGYPLERMVVWDPREDLGGDDPQRLREADFVLWKGHCSVHALFRPEHVDEVRVKYPDMKVIVHPECKFEVVQKADLAGSTAYIVKQIDGAPAGSQWAVGTEVHLIQRLARRHPEQKIIVLSDCQCLCTTMYRIDLPHLCWVLENLVEGRVVNEIKVDETTRRWALVALERMLSIKASGNPAGKSQPAGTSVD